MRTGIFRTMAVHAVGNIEFRTARRERRMMADNASRGVRRAKLAIRRDTRAQAEQYIAEQGETERLEAAMVDYHSLVACLLENRPNPNSREWDVAGYDLSLAAHAARISPNVYERDKAEVFGPKCDYCGFRGCTMTVAQHRELGYR